MLRRFHNLELLALGKYDGDKVSSNARNEDTTTKETEEVNAKDIDVEEIHYQAGTFKAIQSYAAKYRFL